MASIRDQILDAVVAALNTATPAGVPQAARHRLTPYELANLPAIDVAPIEEQAEGIGPRLNPSAVKRTLRFKVRCWARGDAPEVAADAMVSWATKVLAGNRLGGLAHGIEEVGTSWTDDVSNDVFGVAEVEFIAQYQTKAADQGVNA